MKLLAIETAAEACSAALYIDGGIKEEFALEPRRHGELILPMMDRLLSQAGLRPGQLDALAFGRGPGSFTGVRIATAVIQGVAFAVDLPVVPVSTLAALAQRLYREQGAHRILPAFDARMNQVYWAAYELGDEELVVLRGAEEVCAPDEVPLPEAGGWRGVGSGWRSYERLLRERLGSVLESVEADCYCSARDIALLGVAGLTSGRAVSAEKALPVYLRDRVTR